MFALIGTLGALADSSLGKIVDGEHLLFLFGLLMLAVGAKRGDREAGRSSSYWGT